MDEADIRIIRNYIDMCLCLPKATYDKESFEVLSYSRWAAYSIFDRAVDELFKPPPYVGGDSVDLIDIIEEFAFDMRLYSEMSENDDSRELFKIAESTANDILYFYIQERKK